MRGATPSGAAPAVGTGFEGIFQSLYIPGEPTVAAILADPHVAAVAMRIIGLAEARIWPN